MFEYNNSPKPPLTRRKLFSQIAAWAALVMFISLFLGKDSLTTTALLLYIFAGWIAIPVPYLPDSPKILGN